MPPAALSAQADGLPVRDLRMWAAALVLAVMLGVSLFAGFSLTMNGAAPSPIGTAEVAPAVISREQPPAPEPLAFRPIPTQSALELNAAVPVSAAPNPAARAFLLRASSHNDRLRALECLTAAVYYEAATEPADGQRAVAQVVLNRVRHPAYPGTVCGVVFQGSERTTGCQFTFTCDGSMARRPVPVFWERAKKIAAAAIDGAVYAPVGHSTHYHTNWVVPYWSASLDKVANVGTHIFYRWQGGWGRPGAFGGRYQGIEPQFALMRSVTSLPSSLADAAGATSVDAQAKLAAEEAHGSVDSFHRAVIRRYEPATREGVATTLAKQSRSADAVAASHRWALTGEGMGTAGIPLGQKAETAAAAPPPPACLEGVKQVAADGSVQPVNC